MLIQTGWNQEDNHQTSSFYKESGWDESHVVFFTTIQRIRLISTIKSNKMSTVFIGNPGSTFSIFIAKSRLALGFSHTYLFRKYEESIGEWVNSCDVWCVFDKRIVNYHS